MKAIGAVFVVSSLLNVCSGVPEYRVECGVWDNATSILNNNKDTLMTCDKNIQCTGLDCSGLYQYRGLYSADNPVELNYCFGIAIHPCHHPVDLHFYVDMLDEHIHFQRNVVNSTEVEIPGLNYDIGELGKVEGYLKVIMIRTKINGHRYVEVGMVFKLRVHGAIAMMGEWPESMQQTLMPKTMIPVPHCDTKVVTPAHNPSTCTRYVLSSTSSPLNSSTTPGPGKRKCKANRAYDCPDKMMCLRGFCRCQYGIEGPTCNIIPRPQSTTPFFINVPEGPDGTIIPWDDNSKDKTKYIIVGVCVGGIVLIMGIVAAILLVNYRNHKRRYGNHQPLINNEEEEDDDPIDVST